MKRCPKCNSTYTDESLSYCLADGTQLVDSGTEPMTVVIPDGQPSQQTVVRPQPPAEKHGIMKWIIAGFLLAAFAGLVIAAIAAAFYFGSRISVQGGEQTPTPAVSPTPKQTPTPQPTPTVAANTNTTSENTKTNTNDEKIRQQGMLVLAKVDAPGDGFLALRSEPSDSEGERLGKIPHGSYVSIEDCQREQKTVSGKKGRWCMVSYENRTGWVFDAWLKRDQ
jgi:hypothetical protein